MTPADTPRVATNPPPSPVSSPTRSDTHQTTVQRKSEHLQIAMQEHVESSSAPSSRSSLLPEALPDGNLADIDTRQRFLNRTFDFPLVIAGMTGGVEQGRFINTTLARAASHFGIPMGLGSLKAMIHKPELAPLFDVRPVADSLFLIGNLGLVSFNYGVTLDHVKALIDRLQLDAFAFHLNALQECIQPEGERNFSNLYHHLEAAVLELPVPVLVKEVGSGMTATTYQKLASCGVAAVDVGGRGGTSWSVIEGQRGDRLTHRLGTLFRDWGLTTRESIQACDAVQYELHTPCPLVATGGIRNGIQAAELISDGASMVGIALPLLRAILSPPDGLSPDEALHEEMLFFTHSLRIALFCSGKRSISDLEIPRGQRR